MFCTLTVSHLPTYVERWMDNVQRNAAKLGYMLFDSDNERMELGGGRYNSRKTSRTVAGHKGLTL